MKKNIMILLTILIFTIGVIGCTAKPNEKVDKKASVSKEADKKADETKEADKAKESKKEADDKADEDKSLDYIKEKGNLVLGLDDTFPPMGFRDEEDNSKIIGFDIDLATEVCKRLEIELKLQPIDWGTKDVSLSGKKIDVIWNGLTITDERKEKMEFSRPYVNNKQIVIVKEDAEIDKKVDLKGKKVGVQLDSSGEQAFESDKEIAEAAAETRKYETYVEALSDLQNGRIDAVIVDEIMGRWYISKKEGFKVTSEDFGTEQYGVGFRKGDVKFRDAVNEALESMIEDGTAGKISEKWFGENIVK